ncbi:MAG: hypothetical protein WCV92_00980 [Candidatus Buchananbacteria bacterium]
MKKNLYILISVFVILIPLIIPKYNLAFDISSLLTIVTLIFGLLIGFFIAGALTNHINLNSQLANGNATLTIVYNLTKLINKKESKKLSSAIDTYLIETLNNSLIYHNKNTDDEFYKIINLIDNIKSPNNAPSVSIYQNLHSAKADLFRIRQNIIQIAPKTMSRLHWLVIALLAIAMLILTFALRDGSITLYLISSIISACVYWLLLILHHVDNNKFLENQLAYEDVQNVFKSIGQLRYYPELSFKQGMANIPKEDYRIGITNKTETKIKTIRLT